MKNKILIRFYITFCLYLICSFSAHASAYWIDVKGSNKINEPVNIELCYGSMDEYGVRHRDTGKELQLAGDFRMRIVDSKGIEQELQLVKQKDCWLATFIPKNEGQYRIIGINDKHPVVDRSASGGENILPIDYISAFYNVGHLNTSQINPMQKLDLMTISENGKITVKAFFDGKPSKPGTKLRVFNPENWEKEIVLNKDGEATFYPTMKGLYIIRQDWVEPVSGIYQNVAFKSKRHRCNLFVLHQ
ncbi:hypothetical protein IRZ71_11440 [Flavobacterium sp. ANB]|uniref:hypothetical protein n=1 Tax=unclassified Flavobacterium TaxID=196869 RepID=UPI0012B84A7A|nr:MULTISPECIES: hypothetical protein [unclassified Flavobacterium]MBF4516965.1 hypothetical protein [Flavobacterium sp. ANB]MTD69139.1 hypothetical protein [Flavobacterium sp. LC2016-13]